MARKRRAAAAREQPERVVEPLRDLLGRQHAHARRGELDRERNAVEAAADVVDSAAAFALRELNDGDRRLRALDEQLHRLGARRAAERATPSRWRRRALRGSSRECVSSRTAAQQRSASAAQASTRCSQLSSTMSDALSPIAAIERLTSGRAAAIRDVERRRDFAATTSVGSASGARSTQPMRSNIADSVRRELAGEARLAAAAGAREGEQPRPESRRASSFSSRPRPTNRVR